MGGSEHGPLHGLRVVDFGQYIAAPGAGQNMADLGADVIKVEPPAGDQARSIGDFGTAMVRANNRGKRSIVVNLRSPDGRHVAEELIASADVLLHNFRPGVVERLGLDPGSVLTAHPRMIYGFVTGFGSQGPSAHRVGLDIAAQAEFGVMDMTGEEQADPQRVGFAVADVLAAQALTSGVLAALLERGITGRGQVVETSLMEAIVHAQGSVWAEYGLTGVPPRRSGNGQALAAPAADLVSTQDGGALVLSAYTEEKFATLCAVIGRHELVGDPRFGSNASRVAHRAELLAILEDTLGHLGRDAALNRLREVGIVCGAVRSFDEVVKDPDLAASGLIVECESEEVSYSVPATPFSLGHSRRPASTPAPEAGAHTRQILTELGRNAEEIEQLLRTAAVADTTPSPSFRPRRSPYAPPR